MSKAKPTATSAKDQDDEANKPVAEAKPTVPASSIIQKVRAVFLGHRDGVTGLALIPQTRRLYSCSYDGTIREWDSETTECTRTFYGHDHTVWCMAIHNNGASMFSCSRDRTVREWEVLTAQWVQTFEAHNSNVRWLTLHNDRIYTVGDDCVMREFQMDGTKGRVFAGHSGPVTCVKGFQGALFTASADYTAKQWSLDRGACAMTYSGHLSSVSGLDIDVSGTLFTASHDFTIREWNIETGQCTFIYKGHTFLVLSVVCAPPVYEDHNVYRLFSSSADTTIREWDTKRKTCLRSYVGHEGYVWHLLIHENRLYSASNDGAVKLWEVPNW